jgi:hypothetical protein
MLNIMNDARNAAYRVIHSIGIIWGIEGYLSDYFSLTF